MEREILGKPSEIVLRVELIQRPDEERAPLVRLVLPRGIALRFYLVALFEAQCRLGVNEPMVVDRAPRDAGRRDGRGGRRDRRH